MRPYADSDWEEVRAFILQEWGEGHPMACRGLFDWQFRGFGVPADPPARSLLLFVEGELAGFRGVIPGLYQCPGPQGPTVLPGGSLAMWRLRQDCRGKGLGLAMHLAADRMLPVLAGAGSNPSTSMPIYLENGVRCLDSMNRYLALLDRDACAAAFGKRVSSVSSLEGEVPGPSLSPVKADPVLLAGIWKGATFPAGFFSLYRNAEFWRWRYLESAGFRYETFVDPECSGFAVARLEDPVFPENPEGRPAKVLRLIELVPAFSGSWLGEEDPAFCLFLKRCLDWAKNQGCLAADFHCSSGAFGPLLEKAGFTPEEKTVRNGVTGLPRLFNGETGQGRPINALVRAPFPVSFERVYMVKSDNDMDRPRRLADNGQVLY